MLSRRTLLHDGVTSVLVLAGSSQFEMVVAAQGQTNRQAQSPNSSQVDTEVPRPLGERGLENVVAFIRLLGYLRYFHPSDEAAQADWEHLAITGMPQVEQASDASALADALTMLFLPIAPTIRVYPSSQPSAPPALPAGAVPTQTVRWRHFGLGTGRQDNVYSSERVYETLEPGKGTGTVSSVEQLFVAELGGGVSGAIPLVLYADAGGTLPRAPAVTKPEHRTYSARDRATRLADVALAWNVFQHFYPYFDVVQTDWPRALRDALKGAATNDSEEDFLKTLRRLVAALHDGHGRVGLRGAKVSVPPVVLAWAEDSLVILSLVGREANGLKAPAP